MSAVSRGIRTEPITRKKKVKEKKSDIESLGEIKVTGGKDTSTPTKILRSTNGKGRAIGRRKQVGGTSRVPIYKNVKNYDDYTNEEKSKMSDAEYNKMEKSSTIQYKNPDYKGPKKKMVNSARGFSEGGMIVSSLYESF